jgi:uncharacterized protein (DUF433 family)
MGESSGRLPSLSPIASAGQRWRFRRNVVIYVAHQGGLSDRLLADVFDLTTEQVQTILAELATEEKNDAEIQAEPRLR